MPRNVRNFWVDLDVDGRANRINAGPQRKDGGMTLRLYVRDEGMVTQALTVKCYAEGDTLTVSVLDENGWEVHTTETKR